MTIGLLPTFDELPSNQTDSPKWYWNKRFSVPRPNTERPMNVRPYESFRDRKETDSPQISYGFASLNTDERCVDEIAGTANRSSPTSSIFSIYGGGPGPSKICEQPTGAQADVFIASLGEKNLHLLRKFLESSPRQDNQYFIWIKDHAVDKFTVISIKTLENHLKSSHRVRRVKWHQMPTDMMSVYRYSMPSITYVKSKDVCDWMLRQRKRCIFITWFIFILLLFIVIVLGSLNSDSDVTQHYLHYNSNITQITLETLRNITVG